MAFPKSSILSSSDLCEIVNNGKSSRRFCFILGSGASVESGIPSGNTLEMRWMDCLMGLSGDSGTNPMDPDRTRHFADMLHKEKKLQHPFPQIEAEWKSAKSEKRSMSSEYYFDIYRLRFHLDPPEGYRYLEKVMDPCKPSLGYHALALILAGWNRHAPNSGENLHNLVITTNFDSLVEDALSLYTDSRPLVANHESLAAFIHPDIRRPIVAKVHRGLMYDPFNSPNHTNKLKKEWSKILGYALNAYTPIVVGYGGGDGSLMSALQKANFRNGIYWCYRRASGLPEPKICDFVEKQNGFLVEIEGFDALMMELGITLFDQRISPDETRSYFKTQSDRRMGAYTNQWNALRKIPHISKILEPIRKAEEEAQESREDAGTLTYWDHFDRAYEAAEKGDHDTAIQEYTLAIEKDPNHPYAYNNRGISYAKLEQHERAIQDYDKAIELDPNDADAYYNQGNNYAKLGQNERAIQDYDKAIELNRNNAGAYNSRAFAYAHMDEFDKAISDIEKSLSLNPDDPYALHTYGFIYLRQKLYDKAIEYFTKALSFDDSMKDVYADRAKAYRATGETALAEADEAKAMELEAEEKKRKS